MQRALQPCLAANGHLYKGACDAAPPIRNFISDSETGALAGPWPVQVVELLQTAAAVHPGFAGGLGSTALGMRILVELCTRPGTGIAAGALKSTQRWLCWSHAVLAPELHHNETVPRRFRHLR